MNALCLFQGHSLYRKQEELDGLSGGCRAILPETLPRKLSFFPDSEPWCLTGTRLSDCQGMDPP